MGTLSIKLDEEAAIDVIAELSGVVERYKQKQKESTQPKIWDALLAQSEATLSQFRKAHEAAVVKKASRIPPRR